MDEFIDLRTKLINIKNMGWIKVDYNTTGKVGLTIEDLLGIEHNRYSKPDYKGIEIKTKAIKSRPNLSLFSTTPDCFEDSIKYIHRKYGYPNKSKTSKVFNLSVTHNDYTCIANYCFKLNTTGKDLVLDVYNKKNELIDSSISWSYELLENKLNSKLNKLAIIYTLNKKVGTDYYFKIKFFRFYKLKNFKSFLSMIKRGNVRVTFRIGTFSKGNRKGEIHDHGTSFDVNILFMNLLFDIVE